MEGEKAQRSVAVFLHKFFVYLLSLHGADDVRVTCKLAKGRELDKEREGSQEKGRRRGEKRKRKNRDVPGLVMTRVDTRKYLPAAVPRPMLFPL